MKLNYLFKKKDDNKNYGEIIYNKDKKELTITYEGELDTKDMISLYENHYYDSILAFSRIKNNKQFIIKSNRKIFTYCLKENSKKDDYYYLIIKEENDDDYDLNNSENIVQIIISEINPDEWYDEINKFLWLNKNDIYKKKIYDKNKNEIGEILFGEYFKGKIYKYKYYEKTFEDSKDLIFFGLNTGGGYDSIAKNIACILNNYQEFVNDFSEKKFIR